MTFLLYIVFITGFFVILLFSKKLFCKQSCSRLDGKHVVVTGGSSGIGKSVAVEAAKLGANITIIARDSKKLEEAVNEISFHKVKELQKITYISLDMSQDYAVIQEKMQEIEESIGPIFMLVNCVGKAVCSNFEEESDSNFRFMLNVNYLSTVYPTQIVAKSMRLRKEGHIVICGSQASLLGIFGMSAYCGSKFALRGYAEALYMEMIPYNVSVTLCLPPDTETPGYEEENRNKPEETKLISQSAGLFQPEEVAKQLINDTLRKRFFSTIGLESYLLTTLCSGMSPFSSVGEIILQVSLMSFFRLVGIFYQMHFRKIILRCSSKKLKKTE